MQYSSTCVVVFLISLIHQSLLCFGLVPINSSVRTTRRIIVRGSHSSNSSISQKHSLKKRSHDDVVVTNFALGTNKTNERNIPQSIFSVKKNSGASTRREMLLSSSCYCVAAASVALSSCSNNALAATTETTTTTTTTTKTMTAEPYADGEKKRGGGGPFSSHRRYKTVTLSNGLRVLLVSDKKANGASAALSVGGAGQFSDPTDLPGLAHLTEHMMLSFVDSRKSPFSRKSSDFEEWLIGRDGSSNGFTAHDLVCFHFAVPDELSFPQALKRFAGLFVESNFVGVCRREEILKREVRRVDSELDDADRLSLAKYYLVKSRFDPNHPYSRFAAGDLDTLEKLPREAGIDVAERLIEFYREHYLPRNALLVVVSPNELGVLERLVSPFSAALSRRNAPQGEEEEARQQQRREFPEPFKSRNSITRMILYRSKTTDPLMENLETLSLEWPLRNLSCTDARQVAFVLSQIIGRRGPGSLYLFLFDRGWVPSGSQGVPRISFVASVERFQLMKLDITITRQGFINRSAVVAAIYESIDFLRNNRRGGTPLYRELITRYAATAELHGYVLAPRPPDAIELAVDAQEKNGFDLSNGVGSDRWWKFPSSTDSAGMLTLGKYVKETLLLISDPANAFTIVTATDKTLKSSKESIFEEPIPPVSSRYWQKETVSGAKYCVDKPRQLTAAVERFLATQAVDDEDELFPPAVNPLIPPSLRPPRAAYDGMLRVGRAYGSSSSNDDGGGVFTAQDGWNVFPAIDTALPVPLGSPEPSCRCAFVVQLLSSRPARANTKKAAYAELWKESFIKSFRDLAELGNTAGLAYAIDFNKFGMRLCFHGISQNLPSYARRFSRRLVDHHNQLLAGPVSLEKSTLDTALYEINRVSNQTPLRKRQVSVFLREATTFEAAIEGIAFLKSCSGDAVYLAQGDLPPKEAVELSNDLDTIFRKAMGGGGSTTRSSSSSRTTMPAMPSVKDVVVYTPPPQWRPRSSYCSVPGVPLIADACGRVRR